MSHTAVQKALLEYALLKREQKRIADALGKGEAALIKAMEAAGQKTVSVTFDADSTIKGTLVKPQTSVIDATRLKNVLPAKDWKKVVSEVLDKTKLEAAVAIGEIDAVVVASVSTVKDSKASVRISGDASTPDIEEVVRATREVSVRDQSGRVKPAVARRVQPPKK